MGMFDDLQMMQMLRNYQLPPELPPQGYQPLPPTPSAPMPLGPYQQFMGGLPPFMPEVPGMMSPDAAGTPKQTLGIGKLNKPTREYGWRYNLPF